MTGLLVGGRVSGLESFPCFADFAVGRFVSLYVGLLVSVSVGLVVGSDVGPAVVEGADVGELEIVSNVVLSTLPITAVIAPPEFILILSLRLPSATIATRAAVVVCQISFPQLLHTVATIDLNLIVDSAVCKCLL